MNPKTLSHTEHGTSNTNKPYQVLPTLCLGMPIANLKEGHNINTATPVPTRSMGTARISHISSFPRFVWEYLPDSAFREGSFKEPMIKYD